jgi:hypothetical protein
VGGQHDGDLGQAVDLPVALDEVAGEAGRRQRPGRAAGEVDDGEGQVLERLPAVDLDGN